MKDFQQVLCYVKTSNEYVPAAFIRKIRKISDLHVKIPSGKNEIGLYEIITLTSYKHFQFSLLQLCI